MEFFAHIDRERIQSIKEHSYGTADKAGNFASSFRKADWGYFCGMIHDIGASCEISVADFPWRAEETLQALVS